MSDRTGRREELVQTLEATACANVFVLLGVFAVAMTAFAVGGRIGGWTLLLGAILAVSGVWMAFRRRKVVLCAIGAAAVSHLAGALLGLTIYDGSFDGTYYHQEAVIRLAEGWNPLTEHAVSYGENGYSVWLDLYPKASWVAAAAMLKAIGHIEAGKLFNLTCMIAAGCAVAAVLLRVRGLSARFVTWISVLAALNPVAIYQSTTFYVDGLLGSLLTVLMAGLVVFSEYGRRLGLALALASACLVTNLKFTGLIYSVVCLGVGCLVTWYRFGKRAAFVTGALALATGVISVFLLGYAPYVRNLREKGAMLYPVTGPQKIGIIAIGNQRPLNLVDKDRFSRFLIANFSRSEDVLGARPSRLKFPLSVSRVEAATFREYDIRVGGFGPFFGVALLCLGTMGATVLVRRDRARWGGIWVLTATVLVTIFMPTEGWWARYVPQTWLLPLLFAAVSLVSGVTWLRRVAWATLILLTVNSAFVGSCYAYKQVRDTLAMRRALAEMAAASQPIEVYLDFFVALRQRLSEAGIHYVLLQKPPPEFRRHLIPWIPGYGEIFWLDPTPAR